MFEWRSSDDLLLCLFNTLEKTVTMSKTLKCLLVLALLKSCRSTLTHAGCAKCVAKNHRTFKTIGKGDARGNSPLWCSVHFPITLNHADTCDCQNNESCTYNAHYSWQAGTRTVAYSHTFPEGNTVQTTVRCNNRGSGTTVQFNYDVPGGNALALAHLTKLNPVPPQAQEVSVFLDDRHYPKGINYISSILDLLLVFASKGYVFFSNYFIILVSVNRWIIFIL